MSTAGNRRRRDTAAATLLSLLIVLIAGPALATSTVVLPASMCGGLSSELLSSGFELPYQPRPSNGSGGATGSVTLDIDVPGFGIRRFFLLVPTDINPAVATPLFVLLHGQAGAAAEGVAQFTRSDWGPVVVANRFIVLVPVGHTAQGSWSVPESFALIQAGIAETLALYNVDQNRVHGWGFSSGANILHAMALTQPGTFASYAVHAGSLRRAAGNGAPALAAHALPVQLWVGSDDSVYLPETQADWQLFLQAGWIADHTLRLTIHPGGHNYDTSQFHAVWHHACRFAAVP